MSLANKSIYIPVKDKRFRESHGLNYEDFEMEDIIEHRPGRTITETDNIWQSLICMNTHPLHIDSEYAKKTEFGKNLVASQITLSIVGGMTVSSMSSKAIANLGWDKVKLINPVFVGDTLYAESKILNKRISNTRKNCGIVTIETTGTKSDGTIVITYERSILIPLKEYGIENSLQK